MFKNTKLATKLQTGFFLVALIAGIIGLYGIKALKEVDDSDTLLYEKNTKPLGEMVTVGVSFHRMRVNLRDFVYAEPNEADLSVLQKFRELDRLVDSSLKEVLSLVTAPEVISKIKELAQNQDKYAEMGNKIAELAISGNKAEAIALMKGEGAKINKIVNDEIDDLTNIIIERAKQRSGNNTTQANAASTLMLILIIIGVLLGIGLGIVITRNVQAQLGGDPLYVMDITNKVAAGDLSMEINLKGKKETSLLYKMDIMVKSIKALASDAGKLAQAASAGKLDTRADATKHQGEYRVIVDGFNQTLDNVIGPLNIAAEYVDRISKGDIPPKITEQYAGDFNEIKNNLNGCIDAVNLLINDSIMLAKAAENGNLDTRADARRHGGDFRKIVQGVNETLDNVIGPLNIAAEYVDRISKGDIPPKITEHYAGDFNEIKNNLNQCIDSVNLLVTDTKMLVKSAGEGKLDARADASKHNGEFKAIVDGINKTLDNVIGPLNIAADFVDMISKGMIPPIITDNYNGDFNIIKNNLNGCINAVNLLVADSKMLSKSAVEGRLDTRADASKHNGDFQAIIKGVNDTLDAIVIPVQEGNRVLTQISGGNLSETFNLELHGDHKKLQVAVNNLHNWLKGLINYVTKIANGDMSADIAKASDKDQIHEWLILMRDNINSLITDADNLANLATSGRFESRVDSNRHEGGYRMIVDGFNRTLDAVSNTMNVTANIMVADTDGIITFMNESAKKLFIENEQSIRKTFPNFDAKKIIGRNFDEFHKNPSHQKNILKSISGIHKTQITLGDDIFNLFGQRLVDSNGKTLGYMVEWFLYTNQAKFEKGLTSIIEDMTSGRFVRRMNIDEMGGTYQEIAYSINSMLDAILLPVQEGTRVLSKISDGDLSETFDMMLQGDHKLMQNAVNAVQSWLRGLIGYVTKIANGDMTADINKASDKDQIHQWLILMRDSIKDLISEAKMLGQFALEGKLSKRADASKHHGDFGVIVGLINKMMDLIVEPVNESISVLQALAGGDMTVSMTGDYKGDILNLKTALNDTVTSIHDILSQVKTTVDEVNSGSRQVSDASTSLSQGATEQAASLEEITSSMAEIGSQTKLNAENANHANILTNEAKVVADKGTKEMEQLNKAMKEINESSKNISKIIKVIDEIAFQTNLLALNAAVEAARAGRHGKGFAVVAEEVRNLAARSATAAKETSDLIENSIKTVENGASLAGRTSDALSEIKQSSIKAADIVSEIATSSSEQAQAISQINEGLKQIDQVTQTNTASAEESASASEQLSGQANNLKNMISRFILKEEYGYSNKMSHESSQRYISSRREASKKLSSHNPHDSSHKQMRPEDIIKLDEDDFARY